MCHHGYMDINTLAIGDRVTNPRATYNTGVRRRGTVLGFSPNGTGVLIRFPGRADAWFYIRDTFKDSIQEVC